MQDAPADSPLHASFAAEASYWPAGNGVVYSRLTAEAGVAEAATAVTP